jgi:hypothetical protein
VAVGTWKSLSEAVSTWSPAVVVAPDKALDRAQWNEAVNRASGWIPELSALDF